MFIRFCSHCAFHELKVDDGEEMSFCSKENCWSHFSKCLSKHALKKFLEQESSQPKAIARDAQHLRGLKV